MKRVFDPSKMEVLPITVVDNCYDCDSGDASGSDPDGGGECDNCDSSNDD